MRLLIYTFLISSLWLSACGGETHSENSAYTETFEDYSAGIKDSLLHLHQSYFIKIQLDKVSATESEDDSTLEWILTNGTEEDFKNLLYNQSNENLKAIGVKGLIRKKSSLLYKHLLYAFDQDLNIQYGMYCQKLGGYFLYQLDYLDSENVRSLFTLDEIKELNLMIETRMFGCT